VTRHVVVVVVAAVVAVAVAGGHGLGDVDSTFKLALGFLNKRIGGDKLEGFRALSAGTGPTVRQW